MELRQLEYLVAVAEEASFTRAAERVHISQSGVSAQIRALERDLGATLIDRSARGATLTEAGAAAVAHARDVLRGAGALREAVDDVTGLVRGRLVVGMVTGCTITPLFDALAGLRGAHPRIELTLVEDNSDRLIEMLRAGTADLALIGAAGAPPEGVAARVIVSERLVAGVPPGHALAAAARVEPAELVSHQLACLPRGTGVRAVFEAGCAAHGITPDVALEASAPNAVADLAARGLGVAILSESMLGDERPRLRSLAIDGIELEAILALSWRAPAGPALRALLARCEQSFSRPAQAVASPDG